jgi:dCMP deaminase
MGYNGTPAGMDNTMEHDNITRDCVIHAEMNTLGKLSWWERIWQLPECVLFVTHTPCVSCAQAIVKHRIPVVYYLDPYGNTAVSHQVFRESTTRLVRILEQ